MRFGYAKTNNGRPTVSRGWQFKGYVALKFNKFSFIYQVCTGPYYVYISFKVVYKILQLI